MGQVGKVTRFRGGERRHRTEAPEVIRDAQVVRHHRTRFLRRNCPDVVRSVLLHHHALPGSTPLRPVPHPHRIEVQRIRKQNLRAAHHLDGCLRRRKFRWRVVDFRVAEQRNAVHIKPFHNGQIIRRPVAQIRIVVICLQHIDEDVGEGLAFVAVLGRGLQTREGIGEQAHRHRPIAAQQQVRVVPSAADDFAIGVHLPDEVLGVNLGFSIVLADAVLVVGVKALPDFRDVAQGHGPQVGVPFVHGAVVEERAQGLVKTVVDVMAVFMPNHVRNQRGGIAAAPEVVEVDAAAVIESIALAGHIQVRGQGLVATVETRQPHLHVVVDERGGPVGRTFPHIPQVVQGEVVVPIDPVHAGAWGGAGSVHGAPAAGQGQVALGWAVVVGDKTAVGVRVQVVRTDVDAQVRQDCGFGRLKGVHHVDVRLGHPRNHEQGG